MTSSETGATGHGPAPSPRAWDAIPEADLYITAHEEEAEVLRLIGIKAAAIGGGTAKEMALFNAQMPERGGVVSVLAGAATPEVLADLNAEGLRVRILPPPYGHPSLLAWVRYFRHEQGVRDELVAGFWRDHDHDHALEELKFGTQSGHPYAPRAQGSSVVDAAWSPLGSDCLEDAPQERAWLLKHPDGAGMLPLGKVGLLAAQGGAGKTQLAVQLAVSVITGEPWLGHFHLGPDVAGGRVLLALAEEDVEEVKRRLFHVARAMGLDAEQRRLVAERLQVLPLAGHPVALLANDRDGNAHETAILDRLRRLLHRDGGEKGWKLVVLDPLSRWAGLDTDASNTNATRVLQAIETLVRVPGAPTILVPVHSSKAARNEGRVDVRGASGLEDAARWMCGVTHAAEGRAKFRQLKSNYSRPMPEDLLLVRGEHGVLRVAAGTERALLDAKAQAEKQREIEDLAQKARAIVASATTPIRNKKDIVEQLGRRQVTARQAVDFAIERGWIKKAGDHWQVGLASSGRSEEPDERPGCPAGVRDTGTPGADVGVSGVSPKGGHPDTPPFTPTEAVPA